MKLQRILLALNKYDLKNISKSLHNNHKLCLPLLGFICSFCWLAMLLTQKNSIEPILQETLAKEIIRFHVLANSDSKEDQELKVKVKDAVVGQLKPLLQSSTSLDESRNILEDSLPLITSIASDLIKEEGYTYSVKASLTYGFFPIKRYGDYTFPEGTYEALRIEIGAAKGQNWWCIMFPPLCFVDETYSIVDEETKEQLSHILTDDELESLKTSKVKYKFKLWEQIKNLFR